MKALLNISLLLLVFLTGEAFAQKESKVDTLSMTWNLHQNKKEDIITMSPPSAKIPTESSIWQKPEKSVVTIVMVRPRDLGFGDGFNQTDFLVEVKKLGYLHCPEWVPVQAYSEFGRNKSRRFFYTGQAEKYWALGKNDETYKTQDLWKRTPDGRSDSIWIFVKNE